MMDHHDYKSAYLHSNASAAQGLRTISAIDLQKMVTNAGLNKSHRKVPDFSAGIPTIVRPASTVQEEQSSEAVPHVSRNGRRIYGKGKRTASNCFQTLISRKGTLRIEQAPLLNFFDFHRNIPGAHSPGTSTNLYPTPHTVWIYSFVVTSRSFWRIFPIIQNTALLTSTGSSFQTARYICSFV